ncbi:MAG: hypothetical protein Q8P41_15575 [Pseudomonadota bacterium]|nr:hypothetical protein [Pseudomonadota bacterium]
MANIDIEQRPKANILPWLIGLAILVLVVGWLLWRNNRIPDVQGRRDTRSMPVAQHPNELFPSQRDEEALAEALPVASEALTEADEAST